MFSRVLYAIGVLLLAGAAVALGIGGHVAWFVPQLVAGGLILTVGIALERWRYKPVRAARPDPAWTDTGERFVDPETRTLTAVYFDAVKGERHYLAVPGVASRN